MSDISNKIFEEGSLTVKRSGSVLVKLDFVPDEIQASFTDKIPNQGSCEVSNCDVISVIEKGDTFKIEWNIKSTRIIKWKATKF